jgi:hypothetical protein
MDGNGPADDPCKEAANAPPYKQGPISGLRHAPANPAAVPAADAAEADPAQDAILLRTAREIAAVRTKRSQHFRSELFAEPAWDMLLDLFIAHLEGRQVYVSSLCIAASVPATTALRYIQDLERHGEIVSTPDAEDGRRRWLWLSESAVAAMRAILTTRVGWLRDPGPSRAVN